MRISDWSSDVCSSDLVRAHVPIAARADPAHAPPGMVDAIFGRIGVAAVDRFVEYAAHRFAVVGMDAREKTPAGRQRGFEIGAPPFGGRAAPAQIVAPRGEMPRPAARQAERPLAHFPPLA